jgi:hypothetical protein
VRPHQSLIARMERALGARALGFTRVRRGYTPAERWIVALSGDTRVFAKIATSEDTARWVRDEAAVYATVEGPFLPRVLAFDDDPEQPMLLLEDLSRAHWPPPWSGAQVATVREGLEIMHGQRPRLRPFAETLGAGPLHGWAAVADDPEPFLTLGLATARWIEGALPALARAEAGAPLEGDALCHFDVRSDNLCIRGGAALFVDWNHASAGAPELDLGFWLPSLAAEGGPAPETILPDAPSVAAFVSGYFACRAGLPTLSHAPGVRDVQRVQLRAALPWAVRALLLDPPDGL